MTSIQRTGHVQKLTIENLKKKIVFGGRYVYEAIWPSDYDISPGQNVRHIESFPKKNAA